MRTCSVGLKFAFITSKALARQWDHTLGQRQPISLSDQPEKSIDELANEEYPAVAANHRGERGSNCLVEPKDFQY